MTRNNSNKKSHPTKSSFSYSQNTNSRMYRNSYVAPIEKILSRLQKVRRIRSQWKACCPAHNDHAPSLSIRECDDGKVLIKCFAGCPIEEILDALGLTKRDLFI